MMAESKQPHLKTQDLASLDVTKLTALTPEVVSNRCWQRCSLCFGTGCMSGLDQSTYFLRCTNHV
jgi:hypothetical protein